MESTPPALGEQKSERHTLESTKKKESKFMTGLKSVGFKIWLAVMIIGGALAFIVALFLV